MVLHIVLPVVVLRGANVQHEFTRDAVGPADHNIDLRVRRVAKGPPPRCCISCVIARFLMDRPLPLLHVLEREVSLGLAEFQRVHSEVIHHVPKVMPRMPVGISRS